MTVRIHEGAKLITSVEGRKLHGAKIALYTVTIIYSIFFFILGMGGGSIRSHVPRHSVDISHITRERIAVLHHGNTRLSDWLTHNGRGL